MTDIINVSSIVRQRPLSRSAGKSALKTPRRSLRIELSVDNIAVSLAVTPF